MSQKNQDYRPRAIVHDRFGPPRDVLALRHTEVRDPGRGELLVRVLVRPIHPGDIALVVGPGTGRTPAPRIPGLEGVGVVVKTGDHVNGRQEGERVAFFPVQGAWSDFVVVPSDLCVSVPDEVSDATASLALVNPVAGQLLMSEVKAAWDGPPAPFVQTAAGSSVGKLLTAHAARLGLPLVNLVRSRGGATLLNERFPSIPTITTSDLDWEQQVTAALGGPARAVVDAVGGEYTRPLLDLLGDGGAYITYGALAGPSLDFDAFSVIGRGLRVHGVTISRWLAARTAEERAEDTTGAMFLATEAPELFEVAATYDLEDFLPALEHAQRPGRVGTVLLDSSAAR